jgi:hypothetical protein
MSKPAILSLTSGRKKGKGKSKVKKGYKTKGRKVSSRRSKKKGGSKGTRSYNPGGSVKDPLPTKGKWA